MTTGSEKPNEMSEVEKLARLVRWILLAIIWLSLGLAAIGFIAGFSTPQ